MALRCVARNLKRKVVGLAARVDEEDGPAAAGGRGRHARDQLVDVAEQEMWNGSGTVRLWFGGGTLCVAWEKGRSGRRRFVVGACGSAADFHLKGDSGGLGIALGSLGGSIRLW